MFDFLKRLRKKEEISEKAVEHASKGDYTFTNRLKGGGHGQEAIDYMDKNGIEYNITKTYPNGVRIGNVKSHKEKRKRSGQNQSWFPKNWDRKKIKKAGQKIAKGKKYPDGRTKQGRTQGVDVGIKRTNGKVTTIFPLSKQKSKRGKK